MEINEEKLREILKEQCKEIKKEIRVQSGTLAKSFQKVDRDEFNFLEKRVLALENKI